jgi:thiamine kinase-like enzyme
VARLHRLSTEAPSFIGEPKESLQQNLKTTQDNLGIFEQIGTMLPMLPFDDETKDLLNNFVGQVPRYKRILFDDDHVYQLIQQCSAHTRLTHNDLNLTNLSFDEQGNLVTVYDFDNAGMECRVADLQFSILLLLYAIYSFG